jgi:DNA-directed RNA polymerase subunit RPC12/RpoP
LEIEMSEGMDTEHDHAFLYTLVLYVFRCGKCGKSFNADGYDEAYPDLGEYYECPHCKHEANGYDESEEDE